MSPKAELENITPSEICIILFISYESRLVPSLRSMAVLSSPAQDRRSREILLAVFLP